MYAAAYATTLRQFPPFDMPVQSPTSGRQAVSREQLQAAHQRDLVLQIAAMGHQFRRSIDGKVVRRRRTEEIRDQGRGIGHRLAEGNRIEEFDGWRVA